jgi:hypothetical protein
MTDNEIDNMEYVSIKVTPESMDAHLQCLDLNGYKVNTRFTMLTKYFLSFVLGAYLIKLFT